MVSGLITAVGGGVVRDIMARKKPMIFVKHFYACASIIGVIAYAVCYITIGEPWSSIISILVTIILRVLAAHYRWELPKATNINK